MYDFVYYEIIFDFRIPIPISGNTNAATMMVGEKCADIIKEEYLKS